MSSYSRRDYARNRDEHLEQILAFLRNDERFVAPIGNGKSRANQAERHCGAGGNEQDTSIPSRILAKHGRHLLSVVGKAMDMRQIHVMLPKQALCHHDK